MVDCHICKTMRTAGNTFVLPAIVSNDGQHSLMSGKPCVLTGFNLF